MKLEPKHLASYFPYQLECSIDDTKTGILTGIRNQTCYINTGKRFASVHSFSGIKPMLHPLSDLTKGSLIDELWFEVIATDSDSFDKSDFYETCELELVKLLPFMVVQKLFEYHIDVFGLIPEGLAIEKP